uniref:Mannose-P-dolichol utilization defect 1 protein homolog n=1 Tax=Bursaphelenchus xylophilus TaxID=6326 RepID=A0A1I7SM46_BURXY
MTAKEFVDIAIKQIFPKKCFEKMIVEMDVLNRECVPAVLSRCLGFALTAGSLGILVPQILKIKANKSGAGISLAAQILAIVAAGSTSAYSFEKGFAFSQWGDSLAIFVQTAIIVMQILHYNGNTPGAFSFLAVTWMLTTAVMYHYVPMSALTFLQSATIPIITASKGLQILANYRQGSTGQLSPISVTMAFGGCVARIFTSIQETGDNLVILSYVVATVLNFILVVQLVIYWNVDDKKKKKE